MAASGVALPLTGACGCGAVTFEVAEAPLGASYCHCTRCRRRTGAAASANARVAPGSVRVTAGEEDIGVWAPEGGFEKAFCRLCGSALFARRPDDGVVVGVRMGAFDDDPGVRPEFHTYVRSAPPWEPVPEDGLPRYEGPRPPAG